MTHNWEALALVLSAMPAVAKAEYIEHDTQTIGTLSKSNPSIHHEFSIKEEECYKFTFKISGKATKVFYHIENMNGHDHMYVNYRTSPSYKTDASGRNIWSAGYTANGVLRIVTA